MNNGLIKAGIVTAAALAAVAVGSPQTAFADDSGHGCREANSTKNGPNYTIYYTYYPDKSTWQWNGSGYDHWHVYYEDIHYYTSPSPQGNYITVNCGTN